MDPRKRWSLIAVGIVLVVGGLVGNILGLAKLDLSRYVVSSPAPGMVATAVGNGGQNPTQVLGAKTQAPITPIVFLTPVAVTHFGIRTGEQPAYWKVWWDQSSRVEAVVCLQQHLSSADAANDVVQLNSRNSDPSLFDTATVSFTGFRSLPIVIPGAFGYLWEGRTLEGGVPIQVRVAGFSRGEIVSLVTMTSYGLGSNRSSFLAFVGDEYSAMASSRSSDANNDKFTLVILVGIIIVVVGGTRRRRQAATDYPSSSWHAPFAATGQSERTWSPSAEVGPLPPPGWYADPQSPSDRERLQYWDGTRWTGHVSESGETSV